MKRIAPLLLAGLALAGCAQVLSSGAAVVNGVSISQSEVDREVQAQLAGQQGNATQIARQVLGRLIQQRLLLQEAQARHLTADAAAVEKQFKDIRAQFQSEDEFATRLKSFGLTVESLRARLRESLVIDALGAQISKPVTDPQLRQVYDDEQDQYRQIRVKHILFAVDQAHPDVAAHNAAIDARSKLLDGASFAALAQKLSADTESKKRGGELEGFIQLSRLDPAFGDAAWAAKTGVVTQPVRSQFGWHLIVTIAKRTQSFDEVKGQIRTRLEQQGAQAAQGDFLRAAVRRASVIVNPRYGDWDANSASIVAHRSFAPAENAIDENAPGGFSDIQPPLPGVPAPSGG